MDNEEFDLNWTNFGTVAGAAHCYWAATVAALGCQCQAAIITSKPNRKQAAKLTSTLPATMAESLLHVRRVACSM